MPWVSANRFLTRSEQENNAKIVYDVLTGYGWTLEAICALLGNMQAESSINPGIWEGLLTPEAWLSLYQTDPDAWRTISGSREYREPGYGLTQWTPYTKYSIWAGANWEGNGNRELQRIQYEAETNSQWFRNPLAPIPNPPISFTMFTRSNEDVETLANYFLWYYEHPTITIQPQRARNARAWFEYFGGIDFNVILTIAKKKRRGLTYV